MRKNFSMLKSLADVKNYLLRLRAVTESWYAQVLLYLILMTVFFVVGQLALHIYRLLFNYAGSAFGWFLLTGTWIPGIANAIAVAVATRARTLIAYLITTAGLSYIFAITYHFTTGLDVIFGRDHMGGLGAAVVWLIAWFWGGVIGLLIKFIMWGIKWHINSK